MDREHALLSSASHILSQPPPPSLREILTAYKTRGDGDRDMLLAMLNAKAAEDQRLAGVASLHKSLIDHFKSPVYPHLDPDSRYHQQLSPPPSPHEYDRYYRHHHPAPTRHHPYAHHPHHHKRRRSASPHSSDRSLSPPRDHLPSPYPSSSSSATSVTVASTSKSLAIEHLLRERETAVRERVSIERESNLRDS